MKLSKPFFSFFLLLSFISLVSALSVDIPIPTNVSNCSCDIVNISDLGDVDISGVANTYILTYHAASATWLTKSLPSIAGWIVDNSNGFLYNDSDTIYYNYSKLDDEYVTYADFNQEIYGSYNFTTREYITAWGGFCNETDCYTPNDFLTTNSSTLNHSELINLNWSVAGHIIDTNIDVNNNNLDNVTNISADFGLFDSRVGIGGGGIPPECSLDLGAGSICNIIGITSGPGTSQSLILSGTGNVNYVGDSDDDQGAVSHNWYFNSAAEGDREMELEEGVGLWIKNNLYVNGNDSYFNQTLLITGDAPVSEDSNADLWLRAEVNYDACINLTESTVAGISLCYDGTGSGIFEIKNYDNGVVYMTIDSRDSGNITFFNDTIFKETMSVEGNFTGNQIYGEMWYMNHTETPINFAVSNTWYPLFFTDANHLNGFSFVGGFLSSSNLTAQVDGIYKAGYLASGSGINNHRYFTTILVNGVSQNNCMSHKKMTASGDFVTMTGTCIIDIGVGDTLSLATMDYAGTGISNYISADLNLVRIGN